VNGADTLAPIVLSLAPYSLPVVSVYPWPGKEQFKQDFLGIEPLARTSLNLNLPSIPDSNKIAGVDLNKLIPKIKLYPGVYLYVFPNPTLAVDIDLLYETIHKRSKKKHHIGEVPEFK